MKKIVAASLLGMACLSAFAESPDADWQFLGKTEETDNYIHKTLHLFNGSSRSFVILTNFNKPIEGLGQRPSMIANQEFDCTDGRMRAKFVKAYAEHYGLGKSQEFREKPSAWEPVPVAGVFRELFKMMCARKG